MIQKIADGRTDIVFDLVHSPVDLKSVDTGEVSLIRWCAYYGDVSAIRHLLCHGEQLQTLGEDLGLLGAAYHGHWQLCEFLIEQGADVKWTNSDTGETALHAALCKANRPVYDYVVMLLLAHGADPNARLLANRPSDSFMRDCRTKEETPLHRAAAYGTEKVIDLLLHSGADRTAKDCCGDSPLSWASMHLRPAAILKKLCYDDFSLHPDNQSSYDHGTGWHQLDPPRGVPHSVR